MPRYASDRPWINTYKELGLDWNVYQQPPEKVWRII